jgi:hypothetical protein
MVSDTFYLKDGGAEATGRFSNNLLKGEKLTGDRDRFRAGEELARRGRINYGRSSSIGD